MDAAELTLRDKVARVVDLLVARDYLEIERITGGRRLTAAMIQEAIETYGRTLAPPDEEVRLDVIEVEGATDRTWSVRAELFTLEEGRSDLTLECTVVERDGEISVELDNLHVL